MAGDRDPAPRAPRQADGTQPLSSEDPPAPVPTGRRQASREDGFAAPSGASNEPGHDAPGQAPDGPGQDPDGQAWWVDEPMSVFRRNTPSQVRDMFATRSHAWEEAGLAKQLSQKEARKARRQIFFVVPLLTAVLLLYGYRDSVFGPDWDREVRIGTVIALVVLGWALARDIGRAMAPNLFRRMDPGTAGTFGFIIRLTTVGLSLLVALRIAGLDLRSLAVGGAFTAVIIGLAAQQTLGNLIAGMVLLSARPFRVGERVRLEGGGIAVEGVVSSLGLLYTVLADGEDTHMVPNSAVLAQSITPLREPDSVDLRARLRVGVNPSAVQDLLYERVTVPTRGRPRIVLEEVDGDEVVVRILATPQLASDGPRLADEVLMAIHRVTASDIPGASDSSAAGDRPASGGRPATGDAPAEPSPSASSAGPR
jgi:small conductance mechanosensitive channel